MSDFADEFNPEKTGIWAIRDDEEADVYVESPDGHRFYFGNMEGTSKCCFDNARFIIKACTNYPMLLNNLEYLSKWINGTVQKEISVEELTNWFDNVLMANIDL